MALTREEIRPPATPEAGTEHRRRLPGVRAQAAILILSVLGLAAGLLASVLDQGTAARWLWTATTFLGIVPLSYGVVRDVLKGHAGVDLIALLAMVSALLVGEYLAAAVIAVMLATGQALEEYAANRAQRELTALLERAPKTARRHEAEGLVTVDIEDVRPGDRLLISAGEVVPVDGVVASETAVLDESALTGEPGPVERLRGEVVRSGAVNASGAFDIVASATAAESTYAGIIRMVREAEQSRAPFVRLADRYAFFFLPLTLAIAGAAWALSGDPVRFVAVLVVATPCPLILATPIAIVSGVSRAAKRGIIVKGGAALEALTRGRVLLFDKTGTLTAGRPVVAEIEVHGLKDESELVRLAASVDQASPHVLATAIVKLARERGIPLEFPEEIEEVGGAGISARVDGHRVKVGRLEWVTEQRTFPDWVRRLRRRASLEGAATVYVSVDGNLVGAFLLEDPIRPDSARTIRNLREAGIRRVVMVTGDRAEVAESVAMTLGVDQVLAERSPAEKVEAVRQWSASGSTIMVGDGINDAPALAAADVGVAMGARGATASSEAADVVLVVDRLDRLAEAMRIGRRARGIAIQSIVVGMGLSLVAMGFAAAGYLPPVAGALAQEGIDLIAIINALRALGGYEPRRESDALREQLSQRFREEHGSLVPQLKMIRLVADRLDSLSPQEALEELKRVHRFLTEDLVPHELAEEKDLYPVMAKFLGGEDPVGPMIRAHAEISHLTRVLGQLIEDLPPEGPGPEDLSELRRVLYGLYAILDLHFAQEEEAYLSRAETEPARMA